MNNKRVFVGAMVVALVVVISAGGLLASNMGFKLNKQVFGTAAAKTGQTTLAIPYFRQTGLNNAKDLAIDLGCSNFSGGTIVTSGVVRRYVAATNGLQSYSCPPAAAGANFALSPGEGYFVISKVAGDFNYIAVGSHDPTFSVPVLGTAAAKTGQTVISVPYHFTGVNAKDLAIDIGCSNFSGGTIPTSGVIRRYVSGTNGLQSYSCPPAAAGANFALSPGEAYFVISKVPGSFNWTPSHY